MKKILSKLFGEKEIAKPKKFDPKIRVDAEKLSEKEKMDKGLAISFYKGNCRIGKDIWVCNYIDVERTMP